MEVICKLEKRVSKKTGNEYVALIVPLGAGIEKIVLLKPAEIGLLTMSQGKR